MWDRWADWVSSRRSIAVEKRAYGEDEPWYSELSRKSWGGLGGAAGLILGAYEKATGQSQGSWGDYARTGYNVAHDNADRLASGMAQGAASIVPDFSDGKIFDTSVPGFAYIGKKLNAAKNSVNDAANYAYSADNTGYRDLGEDALAAMQRDTNYAGLGTALLLTAQPMAKGFSLAQKGLTAAGRAGWGAAVNADLPVWSRLLGAGVAANSAYGTAKLWGLDRPTELMEAGKAVKDVYSDISNPSRARSTAVGAWTGGMLGSLLGKRWAPLGALAGTGYGYLRDIGSGE